MGVPEDEIGNLNFKEYYALMKRKQMADDAARLNAGYIYAAIHNTAAFGDPKRDAVQPSDIVPSMRQELPDLTKMSAKDQKAYMFAVFQGAGKKKRR